MIMSKTSKVKIIVPVVHYTSRKMKFNVYFYILKVKIYIGVQCICHENKTD